YQAAGTVGAGMAEGGRRGQGTAQPVCKPPDARRNRDPTCGGEGAMKIQTIDVFQLAWGENGKGPRSAFVRVVTDDGIEGYGEASPMHGGRASLQLINEIFGPALIGQDPLDHAVLLDTLWHKA